MTADFVLHKPRALVEIEIDGADDVQVEGGSSTFLPLLATVRFIRCDGAWQVDQVDLTGRYRCQDGSVGVRRVARGWCARGAGLWALANAPQLVHDVVARATEAIQ